jgi:hypothetical protein
MAPEDGEWIRGETASPAGDEGRPDEDGLDEDEPDDEWPANDWPPGPPGPPRGTGKRWGHGGIPGFSVWMAAAVAVLAAAAGVAVGLLLIRGTPTAGAAGSTTPSASAPGATGSAGGGTSLPARPGPTGNGSGQVQIILAGRVLAVSATSITIGDGGSVTAAITSATKVTGTARGIAGVKAGDEVAAQLSGTPGHLTATAIQDPAQ